MKSLVGYTGFVGSNLAAQADFDGLYNSKNIAAAYGTKPDLLVYAGVPAAKFLANKEPPKDLAVIEQAEENIRRIAPQRLVLVSTVDVFKNPHGVDEDSSVDVEGLHAYGRNRYALEKWAREHYPTALIVRLPALFGQNLKKNFLYDFCHPVPTMLNAAKFAELSQQEKNLAAYYTAEANGFFRLRPLSAQEDVVLQKIFTRLNFSSLNFTDSRNVYQFYPLARLWQDVQTALDNDLKLWHAATEPISAEELYRELTGKEFVNEMNATPVRYDFRTKYAALFGGSDGYVLRKNEVIELVREFVECQN
ncbi:MAG: sugar nucleotide-binding protein [Selenomonadaceae bacterium]|nr:sugar nucleotide-binding protein [Selenomonadaceae bacterium]